MIFGKEQNLDDISKSRTPIPSSGLGVQVLRNVKELQIGGGTTVLKANYKEGLYLGSNQYSSAPFSVNFLGELKASSANITGNINAIGGSITGSFDITTTGGQIRAYNDITSTHGAIQAYNDLKSTNGGLTVLNDIKSTNGSLSVYNDIISTHGGLTIQNDSLMHGKLQVDNEITGSRSLTVNNDVYAHGSIHCETDLYTAGGSIRSFNDITTSHGKVIANDRVWAINNGFRVGSGSGYDGVTNTGFDIVTSVDFGAQKYYTHRFDFRGGIITHIS